MLSIWQRLFFLSLLSKASGYPSNLLSTSGCSDEFCADEGCSDIMGSPAETSTDRSVYFKRSEVMLTDGGTYESGEELTAHISNANGQYLMEVSGGTFTSGSCGTNSEYTREANTNGITVKAPTDGSTLSLKAGWASNKGTVKIAVCSLTASSSSGTVSPTAKPNTAPSPSPATSTSSSTSSTSTQTASNDESDDDEASTGENIVLISLIVGTGVLIISGGACLERRRRIKVQNIRRPTGIRDVEQSEL